MISYGSIWKRLWQTLNFIIYDNFFHKNKMKISYRKCQPFEIYLLLCCAYVISEIAILDLKQAMLNAVGQKQKRKKKGTPLFIL